MKQFMVVMLSIILPALACAQAKLNCLVENIATQNEQIILNNETNGKKANLYLIHNVTNAPIWIDHLSHSSQSHTDWASLLKPQNWAAIVLAQKDFAISCATSRSSTPNNIGCDQVLSVCKTNILKNKKENDDYWYAENLSASDLIRAIFLKIKGS